jgi:hypothetical protein
MFLEEVPFLGESSGTPAVYHRVVKRWAMDEREVELVVTNNRASRSALRQLAGRLPVIQPRGRIYSQLHARVRGTR